MSTIEALTADGPVLLEGAMGTELMGAGLPTGQLGERFTLERAEVVSGVHQRYAEAGARVLITNTFNANRMRLARASLADRLGECNRRAVSLAREQAGPECVVAGSIGPTGALLSPAGELSVDAAAEAFTEQAETLANAGVDLFLIETMIDLSEALAAVRGCRRASKLPIIASMSYAETPRGFFTMMGNAPADAVPRLLDTGADAVGANCQLGAEAMVRLVGEIRAIADAPVLFKPNAGQPVLRGTEAVYAETAETFVEHACRAVEAGVELIGGCCGTTPAFIAAARTRLDRRGGRTGDASTPA